MQAHHEKSEARTEDRARMPEATATRQRDRTAHFENALPKRELCIFVINRRPR